MLSSFYIIKVAQNGGRQFHCMFCTAWPPCPIHITKSFIKVLADNISAVCWGVIMLGPITWPPCFLDLTPLDFFLWGYMQSLVYDTSVETHDLVARIAVAAGTIREIS
jgi:hypothetical protein